MEHVERERPSDPIGGRAVHWREGLFVQAHHFQTMQRWTAGGIRSARSSAHAFPYGLVSGRIHVARPPDSVEIEISCPGLCAILRSGLEISDNTARVAPFRLANLDRLTGRLKVFLGVPCHSTTDGNQFDPRRAELAKAYRVDLATLRDENHGGKEREIEVRTWNAGLVVFSEAEGERERAFKRDYEWLEICHLQRNDAGSETAGRLEIDRSFVGPCLVLGASSILMDTVNRVVALVEEARRSMAQSLAEAGFTMNAVASSEIGLLLRSQLLARFCSRWLVRKRVETPPIFGTAAVISALERTAPFDFFLELEELRAELASFLPGMREPQITFDPAAPLHSLVEAAARITVLLQVGPTGQFFEARFRNDRGCLVAQFGDRPLPAKASFYLAVGGELTHDQREHLSEHVQDPSAFKLQTPDRVRGDLALPGVTVKFRDKPAGLPAGRLYFLIDSDDDEWRLILNERQAAIALPKSDHGESFDWEKLEYSLYVLAHGNEN